MKEIKKRINLPGFDGSTVAMPGSFSAIAFILATRPVGFRSVAVAYYVFVCYLVFLY
jgi:hypothetical protein